MVSSADIRVIISILLYIKEIDLVKLNWLTVFCKHKRNIWSCSHGTFQHTKNYI
jgi:hypothetical protein